MTTALAFQVAHSRDPLSHGISDALPHIIADLDAVGSGVSPLLLHEQARQLT
jgi:hypothetical protein